MKKKMKFLLYLYLIFIIEGCSGSISSPTIPSALSESTKSVSVRASSIFTATLSGVVALTSTPIPTSGFTPTAFIPTPTPFITPKPTPIIPPESKLSVNCLEVLPSLPDWAEVNGNVILESRSETITGTLIVNMKTGETRQLAANKELPYQFVISPDRKSTAYDNLIYDKADNLIGKELVIADADGKRLKVIPWDKNWQSIRGITNDRSVLISYNVPGVNGDMHYPFALLVFDPNTGRRMIVNPDFPGYIRQAKIPAWDGWGGVVYDPTASYAIYLKGIPDEIGDNYTFALWDVQNNRLSNTFETIFLNLKLMSVASPMPVWSSDGSQFGLPGQFFIGENIQFELFKVGLDGRVEQLTHLTNIAAPRGLVFSWSPDNSKIAMYLYAYSYMKADHAALLDLNSGQVYDYCIEKHGYSEKGPIWSPDGTQILINDEYAENHNRVILIDVVKDFAAVIAQDMEVVGWMIKGK